MANIVAATDMNNAKYGIGNFLRRPTTGSRINYWQSHVIRSTQTHASPQNGVNHVHEMFSVTLASANHTRMQLNAVCMGREPSQYAPNENASSTSSNVHRFILTGFKKYEWRTTVRPFKCTEHIRCNSIRVRRPIKRLKDRNLFGASIPSSAVLVLTLYRGAVFAAPIVVESSLCA